MTELVAVDLGGTHARFALASVDADGAITVGEPVTLATADYAGFGEAWAAFASHQGRDLPAAAAIAIAAPILGDEIPLTNHPWTIRRSLLPQQTGATRLTLVNDFAAVAHAVARAAPADFAHLCGPDRPLPASGTISVVGPGTGLGVAHLWRDGPRYRVQPTEGGHVAFAPLDAVDDAILARLRSRHSHVSAERVVSGPALADIHAVLAAQAGQPATAQDDRTLWQMGIAGTDAVAAAAVERFCRALGAVAGDLALAQGACAVVIAGGLGLRLRDVLPRSGFAAHFRAKGRFEAMMSGLPVSLITHPQPGLLGAVAAFAKEHRP